MLFGNVNQLDLVSYIDNKLKRFVKEAWIVGNSKGSGKYRLSQDGVFVIVANADTGPVSDRDAEMHQNYIDIQLLLSGEEKIGFSNHCHSREFTVSEADKDVLFHKDIEKENFASLVTGDFMVLYPRQFHRPLCQVSSEVSSIKKAIVKVPKSLIS